MRSSWKRLYVLGGLCCVAGIGSCFDRNEELPQSILPSAQASELSPAVAAMESDRTHAIELRFEGDSATLTRESETALAGFVRAQSAHVREYKILVWAKLGENAEAAREVTVARGETLRRAVGTADAPASVVNFAERETQAGSPAQAAVLAVME